MEERFLTFDDLQKRYQCSRAALAVWVRDGKIPQGMKLGKLRRWNLADLEAWEKEQRNAG